MDRRLTTLLILIIGIYSNINGQSTYSIPKLNVKASNGFVGDVSQKGDLKKGKFSFFASNPNYFVDVKYVYPSVRPPYILQGGFIAHNYEPFNNTKYPANEVKTQNNFKQFKKMQVLYRGLLPFERKRDWYHFANIYDKRQFDDREYYWLQNGFELAYEDINKFYKSEVENILKEKGAEKIDVSDILDSKLAFEDSLCNNAILGLGLDYLQIWMHGDSHNWPNFAQYSLSIFTITGELLKKYNQVIFFKCNQGHVNNNANDIFKGTMRPAFENLLNQFLNDSKTVEIIQRIAEDQIKVSSSSFSEVNKAQFNLLNISFEKNKLIKLLNDLGYNTESLTFQKLEAPTIYNNSNPSSTNQLIGSSSELIGNSILAMSNAKIARTTSLVGEKLVKRFADLDQLEKEFSQSINREILNGPAILFVPNNSELNRSMQAAVVDLSQKNRTAAGKISSQWNSIISNDLASLNNQLSNKLASNNPNQSPKTLAQGGTKDGNSPEAKACAKEADQLWKASNEYKIWERTNNLPNHQYRYDQVVQWKLIRITIDHCRQFFTATEISAFEGELNNLKSQFMTNGGCVGIEMCIP